MGQVKPPISTRPGRPKGSVLPSGKNWVRQERMTRRKYSLARSSSTSRSSIHPQA